MRSFTLIQTVPQRFDCIVICKLSRRKRGEKNIILESLTPGQIIREKEKKIYFNRFKQYNKSVLTDI